MSKPFMTFSHMASQLKMLPRLYAPNMIISPSPVLCPGHLSELPSCLHSRSHSSG